MSPAPKDATPKAVEYNPADLVKEYIDGLVAAFKNESTINAAVKERQVLINDPAKGNRQTLADIYDQFDQNGMKKPDAQFTYHNPGRVRDEQARYTRPDMSDFEKIAFAAVYFKVGSDMVPQFLNNPQAMKCIDAIQVIVANQLRPIAGLAHAKSYQVNELVTAKLENLKENAAIIGKQARDVSEFNEKLQALATPLIERKQEILKRADKKNPATLKPADAQKYEIVVAALTAIGEFGKDHDMRDLSFSVATIAAMDHSRAKGNSKEHKTSELVTGLTNTLKVELDRLRDRPSSIPSPTKTMESSVSSRSQFSLFKPKRIDSPSSSPEPLSPRSRTK